MPVKVWAMTSCSSRLMRFRSSSCACRIWRDKCRNCSCMRCDCANNRLWCCSLFLRDCLHRLPPDNLLSQLPVGIGQGLHAALRLLRLLEGGDVRERHPAPFPRTAERRLRTAP